MTLVLTVTWPHNGSLIWPVPMLDTREFKVWKTVRAAYESALTQWTSMVWSEEASNYIVEVAEGLDHEPPWPTETFGELLAMGFEDRIIEDVGHAYIKQLSGILRVIGCPILSGGALSALHQVDFEFRSDSNHHPVPVCMHVQEMRGGTRMSFWEDELRAMRTAPFGTGARDAMLAFSSIAELSCFLSLNWEFPQNVIDPLIEHNALINGRHDIWPPLNPMTGKPEDTERRPGLLDALKIHGLPGMPKAEKDRMIALVLSDDYRNHRTEIQTYNKVDVDETIDLTHVIAPHISVPHALHHGRFMAAISHEERTGVPIDMKALRRLSDHWERLQLHYIAKGR